MNKALLPAALELFPPSIQNGLLSDPDFQLEYDFMINTRIKFDDNGTYLDRSELFNAIREAFSSNNHAVILNNQKEEVIVKIFDASTGKIELNKGNLHLVYDDYWPLLPDPSDRIAAFNKIADKVNLPNESVEHWRGKLSTAAMSNSMIEEVIADLNNTPVHVMNSIKLQLENGSPTYSSLVPNSSVYYQRLIGRYEEGQDLTSHVNNSIENHFEQLISWRSDDGLLMFLKMFAHSSLVSSIDIGNIKQDEFVKVIKQVAEFGDMFSKLGAIELGLTVVHEWVEVESHLIKMIEEIQNENPKEDGSRFRILSSLIILVEGKLSRTRLLKDKPPFWRRLAR